MVESVTIDPDGNVKLEAEMLRKLGISGGDELEVEAQDGRLVLRRADPALSRVYVEPTNGCNLACRTCIRHSWSDETGVMSMDTYSRLIDGLRGVDSLKKVSFWGFGEPLLHPRITEMVAMAKDTGAVTQMITNGLLLDVSKAEALMRAGLDSIVVSIDGTSEEALADVRAGADLGLVRRNIETLRRLRDAAGRTAPEIGLEFVLMKRNAGEVRRLLRLVRSLEASFLVVSHVLPYTEDMVEETLYGSSAGTSYPGSRTKYTPEVLLPRMDWRRELDPRILELLQHSTQNSLPAEKVDGSAGYCRFVNEGAMAVSWDGSVSPCISMMHSYDCYVLGRQKSIKKCVYGDVNVDTPLEIWNRPAYLRFRGKVRRFEFAPCTDCGGCELSKTNEEDCRGNTFPTCGDCLWAKGVIQCP